MRNPCLHAQRGQSLSASHFRCLWDIQITIDIFRKAFRSDAQRPTFSFSCDGSCSLVNEKRKEDQNEKTLSFLFAFTMLLLPLAGCGGAVVTADDAANTVTIVTSKPYANLPGQLAHPTMAILDDAGIVDTDGDGIRELDGENINLRYVSYENRLLNDFSDAHIHTADYYWLSTEITPADSSHSSLIRLPLPEFPIFPGKGSHFSGNGVDLN